jgi:hypothetical protein
VSFFELPPAPPDVEDPQTPEWTGPPENVLPGAFPLWLVLARTGGVMLAAHSGLAYANGFAFTLSLRRRRAREGPGDDPIHFWHTVRGSEIPPEALRLGIQLGDGSKATVFDGHRWFRTVDRPEGPVLLQRGGSGSAHSWELGFWAWPLPPPGPVAFVCEWPSEGVELTRAVIDAEIVHDASRRAEVLWPEDGPPAHTGGSGYMVSQSIRQTPQLSDEPDA